MAYLTKIYSLIILILIASLFFLPFIINSNLGTIPLNTSFIQNIISIIILALILTLGFTKIFLLKSIKFTQSFVYILLIVLFLCVQFALIHPSYTAPYLAPISIFTLLTLTILMLQNNEIPFSKILFYSALAILINSYWQIIFATLQLINYKLEYKFLFYGFNEPYYMFGNVFKFPLDSRITGGIGQHNNYADILSWGILANIYLFHKPTRFKTAIFWVNLILISIFVARAESRTTYFYPLVLLSYSFYLWRFKKTSTNLFRIRKLALSCSVLLLILVVYHFLEKNHLIHQINYTNLNPFDNPEMRESLRALSVNERFTMWGRAWMMFIQHPLLGVGWNQYLQYFLITPTPNFIQNVVGELAAFANCHNLILQLLATTGVFGTLLFIILILYLIINLAKQDLATQILPLGITLIVLTHSMFEYPLFNVAILIPVLLITATPDSKYFTINLKYKKSFLCLIGALIALAWWQLYVGINNFLLLSQAKKPANYQIHNLPHNILKVYFATASNPYWDDSADSVLAENLLYSVRAPQNQKYFDLNYEILSRSSKYSPNPSFLLRLAVLDTVLGNTNKAQTEVNLVTQNYTGFESEFRGFFNAASHDNPSLNKKLLQLLPHK